MKHNCRGSIAELTLSSPSAVATPCVGGCPVARRVLQGCPASAARHAPHPPSPAPAQRSPPALAPAYLDLALAACRRRSLRRSAGAGGCSCSGSGSALPRSAGAGFPSPCRSPRAAPSIPGFCSALAPYRHRCEKGRLERRIAG